MKYLKISCAHSQSQSTLRKKKKKKKKNTVWIWCLNAASKLFEYLSEVTVAVDVLLLMTVLQLVVLDVEPKSLHDAGPCLRVHAQQAGQPRVQFVLRRLGRKIRRSNGAMKVSSDKCRQVTRRLDEHMGGTWWSSMSRRVHFTFTSPGLLTWKPSVSWVVGIRCHWKVKPRKTMRTLSKHVNKMKYYTWFRAGFNK